MHDGTPPREIRLVRSHDGGSTWSSPTTIVNRSSIQIQDEILADGLLSLDGGRHRLRIRRIRVPDAALASLAVGALGLQPVEPTTEIYLAFTQSRRARAPRSAALRLPVTGTHPSAAKPLTRLTLPMTPCAAFTTSTIRPHSRRSKHRRAISAIT